MNQLHFFIIFKLIFNVKIIYNITLILFYFNLISFFIRKPKLLKYIFFSIIKNFYLTLNRLSFNFL